MRPPIKKRILLLLVFILCVKIGTAQTPPPPPPPPKPLPIDGGLSFLFLSGIAYGLFELQKKRK